MRGVLVALLLLSSGCLFGNKDCDYGVEECVGEKGAYRQCTGGEGYYYWTKEQCQGIEPACHKDVRSSRIACVELATPPLCSDTRALLPATDGRLTRVIDFDGDNILDLEFEGAQIAYGNAAGYHDTPSTPNIAVAGKLVDALPTDLNGDQAPDLLVSTSDPGELYAYLGTGKRGYSLARRYFVAFPPALDAVADLDGDGRNELVGTIRDQGMHILSNLGEANLVDQLIDTTKWDYLGPAAERALVVDFDGIAPLDLAAYVNDDIDVYLSRSDGSPVRVKSINEGRRVGDLDGDGLADIVTAPEYPSRDNELGVWFAGADAGFSRSVKLRIPYVPQDLAILDFNADGIGDIAALFRDHAGVLLLEVFPGQGAGAFATPRTFTLPIPSPTNTSNSSKLPLLVGDIDRDGRADLVTAYPDGAVAFLGACLPLGQ